LISIQKSIDLGADGIELDVHLSHDGEIMVIHDETIDRTTNGKGFVNKFSFQELKSFRIQKEQQIPELSEVFDLVNQRCFMNVELKGKETAKSVIELINHYVSKKNWNYDQFLISSFDWKMLEEVRFLNPKIQIGVLTGHSIEQALDFAKKVKAFSIHPKYGLVSKENVVLMQESGFEIYPWTVNAVAAIQKIKSFDVNGIISDFPDKI
jgi:glycerophosphoryl diester phosphodiesterase